jgi:hypothetical protein
MPTEDQGPNNYTFTVRSTDTQSASATRTFTVIVNEVNRAPVLAAIADRTAAIGSKVSFTAMATDPDIPANALNFSLAGAPPGATIDPNSGVFDWTIPGPNSSTNVVTVVVTDNGSPAISATRTFKIIGTVGAGPYIQGIELTNGQALISFAGIPGETHWVQATTNLNNSAAWITVATNVPAQNGLFQYVDNQVKTFPSRFFRAIIPL